MKMDLQSALAIARIHIDSDATLEEAVNAVPPEHREEVRRILEEEATVTLAEPRVIAAAAPGMWLAEQDRSRWYYWPRMRSHFLGRQGWTGDRLRSVDNATDRVLATLRPPATGGGFDVRGLVLGHVQSGKTGNYTALVAKAADVGYRLFVVLAGMDNGLRMQTQRRLQADLTGHPSDPPPGAIPYPEPGLRWHLLTGDKMDEDFRRGTADTAALQGTQPVLMVVKKNGPVLKRLTDFLKDAPPDVRRLPLLMVDDEADSASIDTKGTGGAEDDPDYEPPTVINRRIRDVLNRFDKSAYVAYTATPFANILIPGKARDPQVGDDLYPRDFVIDLPKPSAYFGAEELFGRADEDPEADDPLDVIRLIPPSEAGALDVGALSPEAIPPSMRDALLDFVLAGATRACRGAGDAPATMLVHTSRKIADQKNLAEVVAAVFDGIRDQWRYDQNGGGIVETLVARWRDFDNTARQSAAPVRPVAFDELRKRVGPFMEATKVRVVNSAIGDILDYNAQPGLKAIAVGGNKLSRGLTLEGLLVSYYARSSGAYDALLQMGRWFGYRQGYADLTRIYTTAEIAGNFRHLAQVERQLRQDISRYERENITPDKLGMRILAHPSLKVTQRPKMRHASALRVSWSGQLFQTFQFPLDDPARLAEECEENLQSVRRLMADLPERESSGDGRRILWRNVSPRLVVEFLRAFQSSKHPEMEDILRHIDGREAAGELTEWTVAVMGRQARDEQLGVADWEGGVAPNQISRTRRKNAVNSLGVITDPKDETACLPDELRSGAERLEREGMSKSEAVRQVRSPANGLLMLYPISKRSAPRGQMKTRAPLYDDPDGPLARDLIGIALSFPCSPNDRPEEYVQGDPGWEDVA